MPKVGKRIIVGAQALMQQREVSVRAEREREIRAAHVMHDESPASRSAPGCVAEVSGAITPESGNLKDFPGNDGVPRDIVVTIPIRLSARLMVAAAVCSLSLEEYARRMVILLRRKDIPGVLIQTIDGEAFEVRDLSVYQKEHL